MGIYAPRIHGKHGEWITEGILFRMEMSLDKDTLCLSLICRVQLPTDESVYVLASAEKKFVIGADDAEYVECKRKVCRCFGIDENKFYRILRECACNEHYPLTRECLNGVIKVGDSNSPRWSKNAYVKRIIELYPHGEGMRELMRFNREREEKRIKQKQNQKQEENINELQ